VIPALAITAVAHHGGPTPAEWGAIVIAAFIVGALLLIYVPAVLDWLLN
jgi:hypothetical protein